MPSFSHGSKGRIHTNGVDLSPYMAEVTTNGQIDMADSTALSDTYKTFVLGQASAELSADGMHDDTAGAVVSVLERAKSDVSEITYWPNLDTVGNHGFGMQAVETSFNVTTPVSGVAAVSMAAQSTTGFEYITSLTAAADAFTAGTTNGAWVDNSVGTNAGASGYEQVFHYGGAGSVVVKIQHSTVGGTAAGTDLITFGAASANGVSDRQTVAGTVARYVRAQIIKTGAGTANVSVSLSRTPYL